MASSSEHGESRPRSVNEPELSSEHSNDHHHEDKELSVEDSEKRSHHDSDASSVTSSFQELLHEEIQELEIVADEHDQHSDEHHSSSEDLHDPTESSSTTTESSTDRAGTAVIFKDEDYRVLQEDRLQRKQDRKVYRQKRDVLSGAHEAALKAYWEAEDVFVKDLEEYFGVEIGKDHDKLVEELYTWKRELINHTYEVEVQYDERQIIITKPKMKKTKRKTFKIGKKKDGQKGRNAELDRLVFHFEDMFEALGDVISTYKDYKEHKHWLTRDFKSSNLRANILNRMKKKAYTDEFIASTKERNQAIRQKREEKDRIRDERYEKQQAKMKRRHLFAE